MAGHSLEQLRASNRRAVTNLLGSGPLSRADLARGTGLSRTTVSSLVSDLIASGHVAETTHRGTPHKGGSGRPPLLVALTTRPGGVAGVDIGHGHIRVAVADRSARVLAELETSRGRRHARLHDPGPGRPNGHSTRPATPGPT